MFYDIDEFSEVARRSYRALPEINHITRVGDMVYCGTRMGVLCIRVLAEIDIPF